MKLILITAISLFYRIFNIALWIYCIMSWFRFNNATLWNVYNKIGDFVEPALAPIRRLMEPITYKIGIDFSPVVLIFILNLIYSIIIQLIYRL